MNFSLQNLFGAAPEKKASRTAQVIALQTSGRARWTPRDYAALSREGYLKNAIVHRAVKLVAENAGSVAWLLYEGDAEHERHPLLDLLARPNPRQNGASFLETLVSHLQLAGNAYVEAVTLEGRVRELHALRPDRMRVVPGGDGWPEAYEYHVAGRSIRFEQEAGLPPILQLSHFHPLDDHYGLAPLEAASVAVDALVMLAVLDRDHTAPPGSPAEGARYLVKATGSGGFAGKDGQIAHFRDGAWAFHVPHAGWIAYVVDEEIIVVHNGSTWEPLPSGGISSLQDVPLFGLATIADSTNPISAVLNNALFAARNVADGGDGDLRYKLSKESASDTVSLLFQDNFSGRAEIGLAGDDDLHLKVSSDGTTWHEGLVIAASTGKVSFPQGATGLREKLTADRTYYVRTDGSDSHDGLTNSSGGAFLTIQKALTATSALDCSIYNVTIQVANGAYNAANVWAGHIGSGSVTLRGEPKLARAGSAAASVAAGAGAAQVAHASGLSLSLSVALIAGGIALAFASWRGWNRWRARKQEAPVVVVEAS